MWCIYSLDLHIHGAIFDHTADPMRLNVITVPLRQDVAKIKQKMGTGNFSAQKIELIYCG